MMQESFIFWAKFDLRENIFLDVDDLPKPVSHTPLVEISIVTQTEAEDSKMKRSKTLLIMFSLFQRGF